MPSPLAGEGTVRAERLGPAAGHGQLGFGYSGLAMAAAAG
jgi:hypothetical protein